MLSMDGDWGVGTVTSCLFWCSTRELGQHFRVLSSPQHPAGILNPLDTVVKTAPENTVSTAWVEQLYIQEAQCPPETRIPG